MGWKTSRFNSSDIDLNAYGYSMFRWNFKTNGLSVADLRVVKLIEMIKSSGFIVKKESINYTWMNGLNVSLSFSPPQAPDVVITIDTTRDYAQALNIDTCFPIYDSYKNKLIRPIVFPDAITVKGKAFTSTHNFNDSGAIWGIKNGIFQLAGGSSQIDNSSNDAYVSYVGCNGALGEIYFCVFNTTKNRLEVLNYFAPIDPNTEYSGDGIVNYGVLTFSIIDRTADDSINGVAPSPIMTLEGFNADGTSKVLDFICSNSVLQSINLIPIATRPSIPPMFSPIYPVYRGVGLENPFIIGKFGSLNLSMPSNTAFPMQETNLTDSTHTGMVVIPSKYLNFPDIGLPVEGIDTTNAYAPNRIFINQGSYTHHDVTLNATVPDFPNMILSIVPNYNPVAWDWNNYTNGSGVWGGMQGNTDMLYGYVEASLPLPYNANGSVNPEGTDYISLYTQFKNLATQAAKEIYADRVSNIVESTVATVSPEEVKKLAIELSITKIISYFNTWANLANRPTDMASIKAYES